jgi:hypothetical protein
VITPICVMAVFMGVVPNVFLAPMEPAVQRTVELIVGAPRPVNAAVEGAVPFGTAAMRPEAPAPASLATPVPTAGPGR